MYTARIAMTTLVSLLRTVRMESWMMPACVPLTSVCLNNPTVIDTHVTPWIQISKTEAYAAQGKNGFNFKETRECWAEALKKYADQDVAEGGLARFDDDGDGFIDALAIVTSGVAAEVNDVDCETKVSSGIARLFVINSPMQLLTLVS